MFQNNRVQVVKLESSLYLCSLQLLPPFLVVWSTWIQRMDLQSTQLLTQMNWSSPPLTWA